MQNNKPTTRKEGNSIPWKDAQYEAQKRIAALHLPEDLHNTTVYLQRYVDEPSFVFDGQQGSLKFHHMVHSATFRQLRKLGYWIVIEEISIGNRVKTVARPSPVNIR